MNKFFKNILEAFMTVSAAGMFIAPAVLLYETWGVVPAVIQFGASAAFAIVCFLLMPEDEEDGTLSLAGQLSISLILGAAWLPLLLWEVVGWIFTPKSVLEFRTDEED